MARPSDHSLHPDISDEDREQRVEYAATMAVEGYTVSYLFTEPGED